MTMTCPSLAQGSESCLQASNEPDPIAQTRSIALTQLIEQACVTGHLTQDDATWLQDWCSGWVFPVPEADSLKPIQVLEVQVQALQRFLEELQSKRQALLQEPQKLGAMSNSEVAAAQRDHFINLWLKLPQLEGIQSVLNALLQQSLADLAKLRKQP